MRTLRIVFYTLLTIAALLGGGILLWALNPSSTYMQITGIQVVKENDGWYVLSGRQLPYGEVTADWSLEITVLRPEVSFRCHRDGQATYRPSEGPVVRYKLGAWADECLDAGPPLSIRLTRSVLYLGFIPLRPLYYEIAINVEPIDVGEIP